MEAKVMDVDYFPPLPAPVSRSQAVTIASQSPDQSPGLWQDYRVPALWAEFTFTMSSHVTQLQPVSNQID